MARPRRPELRYAEGALRRFIRFQEAQYRHLKYPRMSAFAKDIARGTVSLLPTPDDEEADRVGRYLNTQCNQNERWTAAAFVIEPRAKPHIARMMGMSIHQFNRKMEKVLLGLDKYLKGAVDEANRLRAAAA